MDRCRVCGSGWRIWRVSVGPRGLWDTLCQRCHQWYQTQSGSLSIRRYRSVRTYTLLCCDGSLDTVDHTRPADDDGQRTTALGGSQEID